MKRVRLVTILGARTPGGGQGQLQVGRSPRRGRSKGRDWQLGERASRAGSGEREKALGRREVLPSCWRGVSCFPPQRRVKLSESLARPDRRHARARTRPGQGAGAGLLRCSPRPPGASPRLAGLQPPSPLPSRRHIWPAQLPGRPGAGPREDAARRRSQGVREGAGRCARSGLGVCRAEGGCHGPGAAEGPVAAAHRPVDAHRQHDPAARPEVG